MKIAYYTSGVSGSGRLVQGIAIRNALERRGLPADFTILHSAPDARILDGISQVLLPMEKVRQTDEDNFAGSAVYSALTKLEPDILIIDLLWIPLRSFLWELPGKKIFLTRQVGRDFFFYRHGESLLSFDAGVYDKVLATEPYDCPVPHENINPLVIRNHDEILPREEALRRLGLDGGRKHCLFSLNTGKQLRQSILKSRPDLIPPGCALFDSSLFAGGIFPIADYFNAFDFIVCGAGYNAFWEAVYFDKRAAFIPMAKQFENQQWRIDHCRDYHVTKNGADELVEIMLNL